MKEIIVDTNIILRFLLNDIPSQSPTAQDIFKHIEQKKYRGLISVLVLGEAVWILQRFYKLERSFFVPKLLQLISLHSIEIIEVNKDIVKDALLTFKKSTIDLTDAFIISVAQGREIATFDKQIIKLQKQ